MNSSSSVEVERGAEAAPVVAPRRSPHAIPGKKYGWLSRLRSYLILDPLIWLYTLVLGLLALPGGLFDRSGRRLHWFSRAWSWLIMKTILSPVKVTGPRQDRYLEAPCLRGESRFGDGHSRSLRLPAISIPHRLQEGIVGVSDCGLAAEALGAGLHRPAEADAIRLRRSARR